jgi:hypothetical protein
MADYIKASDDEILRQLEDARLADKLETSEEWGLVREAMRRTHDKHVKLLAETPPDDAVTIMQLQQIVKMYSESFLPTLIRNYRNVGEFAFNEAKSRGMIGSLLAKFGSALSR